MSFLKYQTIQSSTNDQSFYSVSTILFKTQIITRILFIKRFLL